METHYDSDGSGVQMYRQQPHHDSILGLLFSFLFTIVSFVAALMLVPVLLPLSYFSYLLRLHQNDQVMFETRQQALLCKPNDAIWLQNSSENMPVINSMFEAKGKLSLETYQEILTERWTDARDASGELMFPKVTRYPTHRNGTAIWQPDKYFDIKNHVFLWTKSKPTNKEELHCLVGHLCSLPLPENQARWQFIIIPPFSEDAESYHVVFRVDHAVGDGVSLVKVLINQIMDDVVRPPQQKRFGAKNQMWRVLKAVTTAPAILIERLYKPTDVNSLHGPKLSGEKAIALTDNISLDLIKKMKNAAEVTVNDIVIACLTGAFHDYFKSHSSTIPEGMTALIPVDLRKPSDDLVLDNQFALIFLSLPTAIDDPVDRLQELKRRMDFIKISGEPLVNGVSLSYGVEMLPNYITKPLFDDMSSKCSMVLSNLPGPEEKLHLAGSSIEKVIFWPPGRSNVGISVSCLSYCGRISVGLLVDRCLLTNPSLLLDSYHDNLHRLAVHLQVLQPTDPLDRIFIQ